MEFEFEINGQIRKLSLEKKGEQTFVNLEGDKIEVHVQYISENCLSLLIKDESYTVYHAKSATKKYIHIAGEDYVIQEAKEAKERKSMDAHDMGEKPICAPMPGKIIKIMVKEGDKVRKNQTLVVVEAMKMQHDIKASFEAIVKKINFSENQMVDTEQPILELEKIPAVVGVRS